MAVANRAYGKDLAIFSVAAQDIVALIADATIDWGEGTVDGTCLADPAPANLVNRQDWTVSFEVPYDPASGLLDTVLAAVGTNVGISITAIDPSGATVGVVYACTSCLLQRASHQIPDGGQRIRFDIVPQGAALTVTP